MVVEIKGLYQVPIDVVADRFGCPTSTHAEFVAEFNAASQRIDDGGGMDDELAHLSGRLSKWY